MEIDAFLQEFGNEHPYISAHTSGSTGKPKEILLSKDDMKRSARASNARFGIDSHSRLACPLSADYIAGKMMAVRALVAGCSLDVLPVSKNISLPDDTLDRPIDLIAVVPGQIPSLTACADLCRRVRHVLVGGGAPSESMCRDLLDAGVKVTISYGMTETCSHVALADAADPQRVFHAMPGISFGTDADGRLVIYAPEFSFGTLTANDIVKLVDSRSFVWLGRSDNIINTGGLKLVPEQLERMYAATLPADTVYYITSEDSSEWGRAVLLVVEGTDSLAQRCMDLLRTSGIPHRMLPKRAVALPELRRTASGKIVRTQL